MTVEDGDLPQARRPVKSEAAFRTISEVADDLDVPQHVLRFWEGKFPQVKPLKRGGGRRYYRPEDVTLLRHIRDLLYSEGYTIKGVQKLLREGGHRDVSAHHPAAAEPAALTLELDLAAPATDDRPYVDDAQDSADAADSEPGFQITDMAQPDVPISTVPMSMSAELRLELIDILEDLEQLRGMLQPR